MNMTHIMKMIQNFSILPFAALLALNIVAVSDDVYAGEVQSIAWEREGDRPILQIRVSENSEYQTANLEGGQRLRITFPGSTMAGTAKEIEGSGLVKGVYPYLTDNGTAVNIDLLLKEAGRLNIEKTDYGYRVLAEAGGAAPAAETVEVVPMVDATPEASQTTEVAPESERPAVTESTADKNVIEDIIYTKLPGNRVQITIRMARKPEMPSAFTITDPARIALDFPNTRVGLKRKLLRVREGAVLSINAIEAEDRSRIVLSLVKPVAYTTILDERGLSLIVDTPITAIGGTEQPRVTRFTSKQKHGKFELVNIDFHRSLLGDGRLSITLSNPEVGVDIKEQAGEIIIDFKDTSVPVEFQRRLDVVDFATPIQTIDTFIYGKNTRMVITPKGKYEYIAYQTGKVFTVNIKPVIEKEEVKKVDEFGYSGEKLSLNFQNIEARAALQILADFTGLNFVVSDSVKGSLTLRLKDVPWDQALDLILDSKNLAMRRKGNVITVAPADEVASKEKAAFEATRTVLELEPLVSELIQINYAKAEEIAALLKSIKAIGDVAGTSHPVFGPSATGSGLELATDSNTLLSPRGQVTVDSRTNSLLIQDTAGKIREVRKLIAKLDQPVRQVMIETRLVEATDTFSKSLGVRFGVKDANLGKSSSNTFTDNAISGSINDSASIVAGGGIIANTAGLNVNLPSAGVGNSPAASIGFTLAKLGAQGNLLNLELSALEQEGLGKIISSPRLITANQKTAKIEQGQERVFTTNVLGVGSVVTKKATLSLEVTPQITPDDRIILDVRITKDNFVDADLGLLNVKDISTQ